MTFPQPSPSQGSYTAPEARTHLPPSTRAEMDAAIADLQAHKGAWVQTGIPARLAMLERIQRNLEAMGERWVQISVEAKGYRLGHPVEGDEWALFAGVPRNIFLLRQVLADVEKTGRPRLPAPLTTRPNGQVVARTFPFLPMDKIAFAGYTGEIWLEPGVSAEEALATQARIYRQKDHPGRVALVLGAGNVSALVPCDVTTKLFLEDEVVLLKMNPVNDYLGPLIAEIFAPLVEGGFLRLVYGGAAEGAYLTSHPGIETIHMTGSDKTYEAIVFGPGEEGQSRKALRTPLLNKPFTAELGGVNPVIVVPGPWSPADVKDQAEQIVSWLVVNAGFNCLSPRVIITYRGWPQRGIFLEALKDALATIPPRTAYYPGAAARQQAFLDAHPTASLIGTPQDGALPWTFIPNLDPRQRDDIAFRTEAFCGLFAETALEASDAADFLTRAADFANTTLWGDLAAYIIIHPHSERDPRVAAALEEALSRLRYGTIGVNFFAGLAYMLMTAPWGAFPGNTPYDIQSGMGKVNNLFMFEKPQKRSSARRSAR